MTPAPFVDLPDRPCYAVIFSSQRTSGDHGYGVANERLSDLVVSQPGFLGMESVRGEDGFGITVVYFETEEAVRAWRAHPEHVEAQGRGRREWYERYRVRVARVERAYGFERAPAPTSTSPKESEP